MKKKLLHSDWTIFYIVSLLFALLLSFAFMGGDDVASMRLEGGTLAGYWLHSLELYQTQTARVLINFPIFIFTDHPPVFWAIYMGICLLVLMSAFSLLFVDREYRREGNHFIACMVMMFPFSVLYEAGWISTATTYLASAAFGFMALVPVRKAVYGEPFRWWEYILFAACLIYGANLEQMMAVLLACYTVAVLVLAFRKKTCPYLIVLLVLCILSAAFILLCPGNGARTDMEINTKYPPFAMLNLIDKAELGYSTALKWLLFDNNVFMAVSCILLALLIWKKYQDRFYRLLALFPVCVTLLTGPFSSAAETMFPYLACLKQDIPYYGLVNAANRGGILEFGRFFLMSLTVMTILAEFVLLADDAGTCLAAMILLLAGTASRVVLGFSPTIFASGNRTCSIMSFCIIGAVVLIYMHNIRRLQLSERFRKRILTAAEIVMAVCFVNLLFLVAAAFRTEFPYSFRVPLL